MGAIVTIWLLLTGGYYLCVAGMRIALKLPAIVAYTVCLPAMPFIVAYRNRKDKPAQAKLIYWLWDVLYFIISVILLIDFMN